MSVTDHEAAQAARVAAANPRKAQAFEIPAVAALMARAFADHPVMGWDFVLARNTMQRSRPI